MKIVADESIDKQIVDRLRSDGHDVVFIAELDPGIEDEAVLLRSRESNSVLLTADKDFGELVFRQRLLHSGIVLIRWAGLKPETKTELAGGTAKCLVVDASSWLPKNAVFQLFLSRSVNVFGPRYDFGLAHSLPVPSYTFADPGA